MARGEASQATWERQQNSHLQEIFTEEYDNKIYRAASRIQPHHLRLDNVRKESQSQDALHKAEMLSETPSRSLPSPGPLPPPTSLPGPLTEREMSEGPEKDNTAEIPDKYFDSLLTHDDSLLEEYTSHYDYGQIPEANYLYDYTFETPIPSSQILDFSPSRTINFAEPSAAISHHHEDLSHPPRNGIEGSPGRRSLSDTRGSSNVEGDREIYNQSDNTPIDLFSSQGLEDSAEYRGVQPTKVLRVEESPNLSNEDSDPAVLPRDNKREHQTYERRRVASPSQQVEEDTMHLLEERHGTAGGSSDYFPNQGGREAASAWEDRNIKDETERGSNRQQVSSREGSVSTTTGEKDDERDVSEINRSRLRETEKLLDILDDILREVNITEQLSRSPRNPEDDPSHTGGSHQQNS